jgi:spermidine synthase
MPLSPVQAEQRSKATNVRSHAYLPWYFAFFVISGFCGLVYEVVWVRLAMASFGVTTALVSIVLSIFMGGLGLGSWGAGKLMRKLAAPSALRLYALVEFLIGCSAIAVPAEVKLGRAMLLRAGAFASWQTWHYYVLAGVLLVIALLPWCTLLGSTFPILMSVIRGTSRESERSFSYLYLANVIGALLGTLLSAFVLIELLGFRHTLWFGGALNAALALTALVLGQRVKEATEPVELQGSSSSEQRIYGLPRVAVPILLFTTGMVSMGCEVVWMREYTPYLGNFVYAFAVILAVYLLATCLGARDYRRWSRSHKSSESAGVWTLLAVSVLLPAVGANPMLPFTLPGLGGLRIIAIWLFCSLTGFLTPLLVDVWSAGEPDKAGTSYAFNVLGCIAGPLLASFCLEPWIGERWSLLVLSLPVFLIAGALSFSTGTPKRTGRMSAPVKFITALAVSIVLLWFSSDYETLFSPRSVRRDHAATVIATGTGFDRSLMVNGVGMTMLSPITKYIAHLPLAAMQRPPRNGLVICFGMGTSFRSMLSWGIPTTAVDLIPSVPKVFGYFHSDAAEVEQSPGARIVVDDGRRFLDGAKEKFDVILVDPPPPVATPGSSLLYSKEFYDVIKQHLSDDGVFQSWYPLNGLEERDAATTASVAKTLRSSFPYVRAFRSFDGRFGIHFLASMRPISVESGSVLASRIPKRAAADLTEWGPEHDVAKQFDLVLAQEIPLQQLEVKSPDVPFLTDDRPVNEYFLLRRWFGISR